MKNIKSTLLLIITLIVFTSCEIVQETKFETDGSGRYSLGFDLSEMMKMGNNFNGDKNNKQLDTLIIFSDFLKAKKDSISKLSNEEQEKIKQLESFTLYVKADSISKKFEMKINYDFNNLSELKLFGEKLEGQNIKELEILSSKTNNIKKDTTGNNFPDFNKYYNTTFNKKRFTVKLNPKGIAETERNKDTTMTKDNPMADLIRFKSRYFFPYKIKNVDNENVRILPNFKGVEISGNLFEINSAPNFFEINIEFESE